MEKVCTLSDPKVEISIMKESSLHIYSYEDKARRMAKGTKLMSWSDGKMCRCVAVSPTAVEYSLQPSSLVFHESHGLLTLKELVAKIPGCSRVFGYQDFPANIIPGTLKPSKAGTMVSDQVGHSFSIAFGHTGNKTCFLNTSKLGLSMLLMFWSVRGFSLHVKSCQRIYPCCLVCCSFHRWTPWQSSCSRCARLAACSLSGSCTTWHLLMASCAHMGLHSCGSSRTGH